ncbi:MAG: D-glycerate dehydrogenase [Paracoccaceae bacterium]
MKPKVLITRPMTAPVEAEAQAAFDLTIRASTQPCSADEMTEALLNYDGVLPTLGDMFSADIFKAAPNPRAKVLANFGVGYNHIDVEAARGAGLAVSNTPGAVTDATADIAMTLILMSARRAAEGERLVRSGNWKGWHPTQMLGLHVSGKTVGIIGMGRIGQAIARRCVNGFGMNAVFFNRSPKDVDFPASQVESIAELAAMSDIVVAAVPGGANTHHLIDEHVFAAMQSHARFINISRGDVVNEAALVAALEAGQIGGAGLDVYEFEPKVSKGLFRDDVVLLPHLGTAAEDVRTDMGRMALANLKAFFDGQSLPNAV